MRYYDVVIWYSDTKADVPGRRLEGRITLHIQGTSEENAIENAMSYLEKTLPWTEVQVEEISESAA